jgi:hypothetical protein
MTSQALPGLVGDVIGARVPGNKEWTASPPTPSRARQRPWLPCRSSSRALARDHIADHALQRVSEVMDLGY